MNHPAITENAVALVTGGASGIGLASAIRFAQMGLKVCIADLGAERLARAAETIARQAKGGAPSVMTVETRRLRRRRSAGAGERDRAAFRRHDILMNNAGIQPGSGMFGPRRELAARHGGESLGRRSTARRSSCRTCSKRGRPGLVINTGSKQGITTPPGDPAYNVSKAGVKVFTEALAHELRNMAGCRDQRASADPRLRLHGTHGARAARRSPRARGRRSRRWTSCSRGSRRGISTSSARTMTCRGRSMRSASCGRRATSSRTARRCRAGTRIIGEAFADFVKKG